MKSSESVVERRDRWVRGRSLLHQAIVHDDVERVCALIAQGANLSERDQYGFSPLHLAQALGRSRCLEEIQKLPTRTIQVERRTSGLVDRLTIEEFEEWTGVHYTPFVVAQNLKVLGLASLQGLRERRLGFFDASRKWLAHWYAPLMSEGIVQGTVIRWVDADIGYGLFAHRDFSAWEYVGTYAGLLKKQRLFSLHTHDYCFRYPSGLHARRPLLIDAESMGNELRYANHSDRANMEGIGLPYGPLVQVVFRTSRAVKRGEQLTYDYGADYWKGKAQRKRPL